MRDDSDDEEEHFALIVEDDKLNQKYLAKALEKKGYTSKIAPTVSQAIDIIQTLAKNDQHFEVIFLDIILEDDETGLDFLRKRKELKLDNKGIIIVMTGNEELHVVQECNRYNIQNYMKKPVTQSNLEFEIMKINNEVKAQKCPIKGYKNERKIGHGATGEVYLVKQNQTKELFAMKRVPNDDKKSNTETTYHTGLKSPTILELKESRSFKGYIYMIIEFAEHGTLNDWLDNQRNLKQYQVDTEQILFWMTCLFFGLYETHQKNVIHRDIKSDNLFLCKGNVLKIGDLGIAKAIEKSAFTVCGTHHYMAPEIHKKEEYDMKADIWAAGVVLYELIMLERPFDGSSDEIIDKALTMDYKHIPKHVDERLHTLIKHTLNPDNITRYSSREILKLDFMFELLNKINDEGIFPIDEEILYKICRKEEGGKIEVDKKIIKETLQKSGQQSKKLRQHFDHFSLAIKLDVNSDKVTYQKSYFSTKYENVVKGSDLSISCEENNIKEEQVADLIKNNYIKNIDYPDEEEFIDDDKNYYEIKVLDDKNIENSMNFPSDITDEEITKSPIKLTESCMNLALEVWNKIEYEEEENNNDDFRIDILASKEYFDFLVEIINIKNINFSKMKKDEKLATILNIYQTMYIHLIIKLELYSDTCYSNKAGLMSKMKSMVFTGNKKNDITYNIGGQNISLYELKHITIRRNKKPLDAYMRLANSGDPREKLIDGGENNKLLLVCLDPPNSIEEMTIKPNFTPFGTDVSKELDKYANDFISLNFSIDDSEINIPKYLKDYLVDFNSNEQDLIKFLLKYYNSGDTTIKVSKVIKDINNKSININYYCAGNSN